MAKHIHADDAMNWVYTHMGDPDFNDPPVLGLSSGAVSGTGGTDTDTGSGGDDSGDHTQDDVERRYRKGPIGQNFSSSLRSVDENENPRQKNRVRKIKVFLKLIFLCSGRILFEVEWCITNR